MPADAGAGATAAPADAPPTPSSEEASSTTSSSKSNSNSNSTSTSTSTSTEGASSSGETASTEIASAADFATRLAEEAATVKGEVDEIELLINQARTEAARHETRRSAAAEKLAVTAERLAAGGASGAKDLVDLANQLVTVGRKAALMEAQIDLLEGKRKSAARLHDVISAHAEQAKLAAGLPTDAGGVGGAGAGASGAGGVDGGSAMPGIAELDLAGPLPPGVSRMVLTAQEDLRREIARQMHDGPAQSLTNIVLQAQIVERLMGADPEKAQGEVKQLTAMVQRTLDATKTFIFDVRPMVLDDLGLVPTLRRASRDRGRRVGVTVDFESVGVDRRLPVELESGLFRMVDDALAAHVAGKPDRLSLRLDWGERLVIEVTAGRTPEVVPEPDLPPEGAELPPALAEMVAERRRSHGDAVEAARVRALARLPDQAWREVASRARILGVKAEMLDEGARLHLEIDLPATAEASPATAPAETAAS